MLLFELLPETVSNILNSIFIVRLYSTIFCSMLQKALISFSLPNTSENLFYIALNCTQVLILDIIGHH